MQVRHCDDYIDDESQPLCLRQFLKYNRLPAVCKQAGVAHRFENIEKELIQYIWTDPEPVLYAKYGGRRVRVVMASRFGDVGITYSLDSSRGYDLRTTLDTLTDFKETPN